MKRKFSGRRLRKTVSAAQSQELKFALAKEEGFENIPLFNFPFVNSFCSSVLVVFLDNCVISELSQQNISPHRIETPIILPSLIGIILLNAMVLIFLEA